MTPKDIMGRYKVGSVRPQYTGNGNVILHIKLNDTTVLFFKPKNFYLHVEPGMLVTAKLYQSGQHVKCSDIKKISGLPGLLAAVQDANPIVREAAVELLGKSKDPATVPDLVRALDDPDGAVRGAAAGALVTIGSPAVPSLLAILKKGDADIQQSAVEALGRIQDPIAVPEFVTILKETSDPRLRTFIARALMRINERSGVTALFELILRKNDSELAEIACGFGKNSLIAIPDEIERMVLEARREREEEERRRRVEAREAFRDTYERE
jgi:HEAT repeat protein